MARFQPCLKKLGIDFGYYNGEMVFPRTVMNRDSALCLYNNHFCLIWKTQGVSFNQAIREVEDNFKMVDNYITKENVELFFQYEFIPKKTESHLNNFIVYDLETYYTDKAKPYIMTFYRLSKEAGKYDRDTTTEELQKSIKDTISFAGEDCIKIALDYLLNWKGEERKLIIKSLNTVYNYMLIMALGFIHGLF